VPLIALQAIKKLALHAFHVMQALRQQPLQLNVLIAQQTQHQKQHRKNVPLIALQAIKKLALHVLNVQQALRQQPLQLNVLIVQQENNLQQE
jgi:hypothetical protein